MNSFATITQKGQLTLPLKLREMFDIQKYSKVRLESADGFIKIIPTQDILELAGKFVPKNKKPVLKARNEFEKNYSRF
jgi:bifunctional DNA-binding transcriptional regulator/antitoxin component of YhaV-PrlF toxin-antitoxin module